MLLFIANAALRQWLLFAVAVPMLSLSFQADPPDPASLRGGRLTGALHRVKRLGKRKRNRPKR